MPEQRTPSGRVGPPLVAAAAARRARLAPSFDAIDLLDRTLGDLVRANAGRIQLAGPARRVVAGTFGKAVKTLDAIRIACECGYGEDALVLARALVNLVINIAYIGCAPDPNERARDYVASGRIAHRDVLRQYEPDWGNEVDWMPLEHRAKRWDKVTIWKRARAAKLEVLYNQTYRFGSSFEHSDSVSLGGYFGASKGENQEINSGPSDDLVDLVLCATFQAMTTLTHLLVAAFTLNEPARLGELEGAFQRLMDAQRQRHQARAGGRGSDGGAGET